MAGEEAVALALAVVMATATAAVEPRARMPAFAGEAMQVDRRTFVFEEPFALLAEHDVVAVHSRSLAYGRR